jgi:uncharacterized membrane protein
MDQTELTNKAKEIIEETKNKIEANALIACGISLLVGIFIGLWPEAFFLLLIIAAIVVVVTMMLSESKKQ